MMRRALSLAELGWGQVSPNPLVGAVLVTGGEVVGEGAHRMFGGAHAEAEALSSAGARAARGTLYVTLEPCTHYGRTPPCTNAIIGAGVARVVLAARDPNPEAGGGVEKLRAAGIAVDIGLLEAEASELNAAFFNSFRSDRPWVTLKLAVSLDGAIAGPTRQPGWITGPPARRRVHRMRAGSDAVAVGMGTVLADDPQLTVRDSEQPLVAPIRIVFSRKGRLPLSSQLARTAIDAPVLVLTTQADTDHERALRAVGVDVLRAESLSEAMRALRARGIRSLLVEGGAALAASLIEADLVDRVVLFQAPVLLGQGALAAFGALSGLTSATRRWRTLASEWIGDDHMVVLAPEGH
jgi:diaminohydroxyphosphoribosylaminopyrimidine deaminase/5-amino-6-(5-phosphoribosylamino)uracil reductase